MRLEEVLPRHEDVLRSRGVLSSSVSFAVVDAQAPDQPLVWVNPAFTQTTGYSAEEAVGRNCRFLQGPDTDAVVVSRLRSALAVGEEVSVTLLNYRKDGTTFYNALSVSPVLDDEGQLTHFVAVQVDVSERVRLEQERARALDEAEIGRRRTSLLAEATSLLAGTLDSDEALRRLADLCVPELCDYVLITQLDERDEVRVLAARHRSDQALLEAYLARDGALLGERSITASVLRGAGPRLVADISTEHLVSAHEDALAAELMQQMGASSAVVVPLAARGRSLGAMSFVRAEGAAYTDDDLQVAVDLGRRAALSVDNARLYQAEHEAALTLQRSLLPELPEVDGWELAPHYQPSDAMTEVGGDLYDVLRLDGGALGLVVGDVVGHDLHAAAAMGHLRGLLRASALDDEAGPAEVLAKVDRLVQSLPTVPLVTLLYARLTPRGNGSWDLEVASAGHPPLALRHADGRVELLGDGDEGLMLGVGVDVDRVVSRAVVTPGAVLVGYTDGLVERRGEDLDAGLGRLTDSLARHGSGAAGALLRGLLADLAPDGSDDTALLVARCRPAPSARS
jgi:PAS domain S-box-containing protein